MTIIQKSCISAIMPSSETIDVFSSHFLLFINNLIALREMIWAGKYLLLNLTGEFILT
jgi:hypothetical protein